MKLIRDWLQRRAARRLPRASHDGMPGGVRPGEVKQHREQQETVRSAFRELQALTGIPARWMSVVAYGTQMPDGSHGTHARVIVRHWDARLFQSAPQVERLLRLRIQALDAGDAKWLRGISWSFALSEQDEGTVPALPSAASWIPPTEKDCPPAWLQTQALETQQLVSS